MAQVNDPAPSTPPKLPNDPKTSTESSTENNESNSGESAVQEGGDVVNTQEQERVVNEESQQEFISDINNNTIADEATGKHTSLWNALPGDDDDDDDEEDDDDDDDGDPLEIGDDPSETKKKIPVM